ncbi:hypothetical protein D3C78_1308990 [compost metagenome]
MRFRWIKQSSRAALISAIVTRVTLKGMSVEEALNVSLPFYSVNPESISQLEHKRLIRNAKAELKRVEENRQGGTVRRRMRG